MSKENGFVPLRRGLWEHVRDGSLTHTGALIYIYMLSQADTRSGVWRGSAQSLAGELRIRKSTVKYALRGLDGRYIRRFTVPGKHICYPILLHKFLITQGQHVGLRLDALNSTNENTLAFIAEDGSQQVIQPIVQHVAPQRIQETRNRRQKKEAQAPPSLSFSSEYFSVTEKQDATLGEAFPWIDRPAEYRKVHSWLEANPERRPKKAARFLHNWFSRSTQPKGKGNGKDINSAVEATMRGFAANAGLTN
jgi:hypothetical protein